jgi:AcrR family transcriptional regulator
MPMPGHATSGTIPSLPTPSHGSAPAQPLADLAPDPAHAPSADPAPATLSRQQILQATCVCLREHGYDATTIRRIAGAIGCAIGSIYRYYRDKRELLYEVTQQVIEPVAKALEQGGDFASSVRQYTEIASREDEAYRLLFWLACHVDDQGPTDAVSPAALPKVVRRVIDAWARLLGDADLARRHWAMMHGCLMAGLDVEQTLAAMRTLRSPRREPGEPPQVVTVMRFPPAPPAPPAAPAAPVSPASSARGDGESTPVAVAASVTAGTSPAASGASGGASGGAEDVCLL